MSKTVKPSEQFKITITDRKTGLKHTLFSFSTGVSWNMKIDVNGQKHVKICVDNPRIVQSSKKPKKIV